MGKKHSEILRNLVKKHGVYETSKILGLSHVDVVMKSGIEIDNEIANTVLYDLLREKKIPVHYEEFEIYTDNMTGSFIWEGHLKNFLNERILVYATPFWDGDDYYQFNPITISTLLIMKNLKLILWMISIE